MIKTKLLKSILKGKLVMVGIGNPLKSDDAFGPELVKRLMEETNIVCIDAGTAPESYSGKIARENPDTVLLLDAAHIDGKPGDWAIMEGEEIVKSGFTTHDISPRMFIEYLKERTKANIYLLGVQPERLSIGEDMSNSVKNTMDKLFHKIKELCNA